MSTVDYNSVSNKYTKLKDVFLSADYVKAEYIEELSVKLSALNETVNTNLNVRLTVNDISADENNNINLNVLRPAAGEGDVYKEYFDSPITFLTDDEKLTKELVAINNDTAVYSLLNATHYILAGTNNGLYYSADKGKTWELSNTLNDVLVKNLKTYNNKFYACTNAGLYESFNGTTWHTYSDPMAGARLSLERDNITDIIQFKKAQSKITIATTSTGYIKFFNESTKDDPRYFILNNNNYNIRTIIEHKDYIYIADEFYVYEISKQTILDAIRLPDLSMAIEAPIFDITSIRNNSINDIAIINDILYVCTSNNGILYSTDFSTFTKIIDTNNVARNLSDTNNFDYIKIANNKIYATAISKQTIYIFDSTSVVPTEKPLLLNNVTSIFDFIFIDNYYMLLGTNAGVYHILQLDDITLVKDKIITQTLLDTVITEINETFNNEIDECEKLSTFNANHLALGSGTYDYELNKHDNVIALGTNVHCDESNIIALGNNLKLTNENSIVIGNNITIDKPDTTILATTTNDEYIKLILTLDNNDYLSGKPYFILKTNNNEQIKEISLSGHTHSIDDIIDLQDNIDYISSEIEIINDNIYNITNDIKEISSYFSFLTYDSFSLITSDHATVFANVETIDYHIKSELEPYKTLINGSLSNTYVTKVELTSTYATKTELTSTYATKTELATDYVAKTQLTSTYATKSYVTDLLKSYTTKTYLTDLLKSYTTKTYLTDNYYSKSDIDTKLEKINNGSDGNTSSAITNTTTVIPADSVIYNQSRNIGEIFFTLNKEEVGEKVENPNDPRLAKIDDSLINSYIAKGLFVINETNFKGAIQCDGKMYVPYDNDGNKQVDVIFSDLITAMENGSILSVGFTEYETLYEANNGIVGVFGWNDGIIRVPSLITSDGNGVFLQTGMITNNRTNLYKAPGLPNILGYFGGLLYEGMRVSDFTGAFAKYDANRSGANGGGDYRRYDGVNFNARNGEAKTNNSIKSSSEYHVYGSSNTVLPPAVTYIPMIQICNFTILAKNDTNTTAIATVADETTNTRITLLELEIETLKEQINLLLNK